MQGQPGFCSCVFLDWLPGQQCEQGLVNPLPCVAEVGGNELVSASHKRFAETPTQHEERWMRVHPSNPGNGAVPCLAGTSLS